jgi:hypothetical protein
MKKIGILTIAIALLAGSVATAAERRVLGEVFTNVG